MGALIFSLLNYPQEKIEISNILSYQDQFYQNHTCVNRTELEKLIMFSLKLNNYGIYYYNVDNNSIYSPQWTFGGNTIFFTYTTLATVGYGNLVPFTRAGKLFCIFYIIIGVPITLLIVAILTEYVAELIEDSLFFKTKSNSLVATNNEQELSINSNNLNYLFKYLALVLIFLTFIYIIPAIILSEFTESNWSFLETIYFCFISLTTIGLGMLVVSLFKPFNLI